VPWTEDFPFPVPVFGLFLILYFVITVIKYEANNEIHSKFKCKEMSEVTTALSQ